jgi:hypothetical protein
MPGYVIENPCCCGGCCQGCCPDGVAASLFAELQTDCGTWGTTLHRIDYLCCDELNSILHRNCETGELTPIERACYVFSGKIDNIICSLAIEGDCASPVWSLSVTLGITKTGDGCFDYQLLLGGAIGTTALTATSCFGPLDDCIAIDIVQDLVGGDCATPTMPLGCLFGAMLTITG